MLRQVQQNMAHLQTMYAEAGKSRAELIDDFKNKTGVDPVDNCHMSIKHLVRYMREETGITVQELKLIALEPDYDEEVNTGYLGDSMIWRKFEDDMSGRYEEKEYDGHSTTCFISNGTIFVFDPMLMPKKQLGCRGLTLDAYLFAVTKPSRKKILWVTVKNDMGDIIHNEQINLSTAYEEYEKIVDNKPVFSVMSQLESILNRGKGGYRYLFFE